MDIIHRPNKELTIVRNNREQINQIFKKKISKVFREIAHVSICGLKRYPVDIIDGPNIELTNK